MIARNQTLSLLILASAASTVAAQGNFPTLGESVLATGQQAPGFPTGITVSTSTGLDQPVMDQNGTLLFRATLADTGGVGTLTTSNNRCLYIGRANGDLAVAAQADDPAPGIPGATLRGFSATAGSGTFATGPSYRISPFGEILYFNSNIYDAANPANTPTTSDQCLFWGPVGGLQKVLREGEEVPFYGPGSGINWGAPSTSSWWALHHVNATGQITVANLLAGAVTATDDSILATGFPGALQVISREGDVMVAGPNLLGGEVVTTASGSNLAGELAMNEAGQVLHDMKFSSTVGTATTANDLALALYTPGVGDVVIAREGMQAPGFPAGVLWASPSNGWSVFAADGVLTSAGETFLLAQLNGGIITSNLDDFALYVGGAAGWTKIVQRNDPTPIGGGTTYNNFSNSNMSLNDSGTFVFAAQLNGTTSPSLDNTAIFYGNVGAGSLTKVLQENDMVDGTTIPGLVGGPWFVKDLYNLGGSQTVRVNARGQMLWHVPMWDAAHTTSITPLLSYDPTIGLRCVLDPTDTITTGVGTTAWSGGSVAGAASAGSDDGSGYAWFNNQGDWTVRVTLTPSLNGFDLVRGHVGTMICEPSSVPVSGGVPHNFHIDCGPSLGFQFYVVLATSLGTRPGFISPFGPQNIPLNPDALWTNLSLNAANSSVWVNNLGVTDANGVGIGPAGFVMPAGYPGFLGTTLHHAAVLLDFSLNQTHVTEPSAVKLF